MAYSYRELLLRITYEEGKPGKKLTKAHDEAENHRFKKEYLFKKTKISKKLYVSRLIQHFLIIQALEIQLRNLKEDEKAEINAFFNLSYLKQLWRTPSIQNDLKALGCDIKAITSKEITHSTHDYLNKIGHFKPKILLTHFLAHVAGFMHGGAIIQKRYIRPHNETKGYQIPFQQYDFSALYKNLSKKTPIGVYDDMIEKLDPLSLDAREYEECLGQGQQLFESMTAIYDDLCTMHSHQPKLTCEILSLMCVSMLIVGFILKITFDFSNYNDGSRLSL